MTPRIGLLELVQWTLYDEAPLEPSPHAGYETVQRFFLTTIGQREPAADYTKDFFHTNLYQAGMLEAPKRMILRRLNALFFQDGVPLRLHDTDLYSRAVISLQIMQKIYKQGPAWTCASPFALFGVPSEEIPRLKERYGIEWEQVSGSLALEPGDLGPSAARDQVAVGGLVLWCHDYFTVEARIAGPIPKGITLAIHLDGPMALPVI